MPAKTAVLPVRPHPKTERLPLRPVRFARTAPGRGREFFRPSTGSEAEWDAAYGRLEDYFRSLHVGNRIHQNQLILHLLQKAARRHAANPKLHPTVLAMEALAQAMDGWFREVLGEDDPFSRQGRLALLITGGAERWPTAFLAQKVPPDCRRSLQAGKVQAGPDLQLSSMTPRPLDDSPLLEVELPKDWQRHFSWPALLTVAVLLAAVFALIFNGAP